MEQNIKRNHIEPLPGGHQGMSGAGPGCLNNFSSLNQSIAVGDMLREHIMHSRTSKSTVLKAFLKSWSVSTVTSPFFIADLISSVIWTRIVVVLCPGRKLNCKGFRNRFVIRKFKS